MGYRYHLLFSYKAIALIRFLKKRRQLEIFHRAYLAHLSMESASLADKEIRIS
jgi:hypothetical protein